MSVSLQTREIQWHIQLVSISMVREHLLNENDCIYVTGGERKRRSLYRALHM